MEGISKTLGWVETDQVCVLTKYTRGYVNDERKITAHCREERGIYRQLGVACSIRRNKPANLSFHCI